MTHPAAYLFDPAANVIGIADRSVAMVITTAKFKRPQNPKRCSIKRYHVWRWRGGPWPPRDLKCQCGLLDEPPRRSTLEKAAAP